MLTFLCLLRVLRYTTPSVNTSSISVSCFLKRKHARLDLKNLILLHCLIARRLVQQNVHRTSTNLLLNIKLILLTRAMLVLFIDMLTRS